jgi:hypothetical protein
MSINHQDCDNIEFYNHQKNTTDVFLDVVGVISNPARFEKRYQLFNEFCDRMRKNSKIRLFTVELQNKAREFCTDANLKLRTSSELWHKENLINIAVSHLLPDWEYVAWIDCDIHFINENWAEETLAELQTYDIVQLFSHAIDMGPKGETLQVHTGFAFQYVNGEEWKPPMYGRYFHGGYGWATTKSAWNAMGGLIEFAILGSADFHMSMAWIGMVEKSLNSKLSENYKELCLNFQKRCETHIKRNIGFIPGTIIHYFHGDKGDRKYKERWQILIDNQYNPLYDIKRDNNFVLQLETNNIRLRDDLRRYFRVRNEDNNIINQDYPFYKKKWY